MRFICNTKNISLINSHWILQLEYHKFVMQETVYNIIYDNISHVSATIKFSSCSNRIFWFFLSQSFQWLEIVGRHNAPEFISNPFYESTIICDWSWWHSGYLVITCNIQTLIFYFLNRTQNYAYHFP